MTSVDARDELVRILEDDLIGPKPGELHAGEILDVPPSRFYLTGFLIPTSVRSQALGAEAAGVGVVPAPPPTEHPTSRLSTVAASRPA